MFDLATSRYGEQEAILASGLLPVGISLGRPKFPLRYTPVYMEELAPAGLLGLRDTEEFDHRYVQRLEDIGPETLTARFAAVVSEHETLGLVLLCFEVVGRPCHRHLFRRWWEHSTGQSVLELQPAQLQLGDD